MSPPRPSASRIGPVLALGLAWSPGCVPEGRSTQGDGAATTTTRSAHGELPRPVGDPPIGAGFEDRFDRDELGPDWAALSPAWKIVDGELCGEAARNRGVWLKRSLPIDARIEFDARSDSPDGDIKAEFWGDGRSGAKGTSYDDATSYVVILGGWKNTRHVLARLDEHGADRMAIEVEDDAQDPRARRIAPGQSYHFRVERFDTTTVYAYVDDQLYFELSDPEPLSGTGHDHLGFNDWLVPVCFDNVKVVPL